MKAYKGRPGYGMVVTARAGLAPKRTWATKFVMRSPRYTTQVTELQTALA